MDHVSQANDNKAPKSRGSGVVFYCRQNDSLLFFLRDDKPTIPYPNQLAMIGGHIEPGESALQTLKRELAEELVDIDTGQPFVPNNIHLFKVYLDSDNVEHHIHTCELDYVPHLRTTEGQGLVWVARDKLKDTDFAYHYKPAFLDYAGQISHT